MMELAASRQGGWKAGIGVVCVSLSVLGWSRRAQAQAAATTQAAEAQAETEAPQPLRQKNFFSLERLNGAIELGSEYQQVRVRTPMPYQIGPFFTTASRQKDYYSSFD